MKRTMELLDVVSAVLTAAQAEQLEVEREDLIEVEWDLEITSFSPGRPAVMHLRNGDPGYPAEPSEYEVDMTPADVACKYLKELSPHLSEEMFEPEILRTIWYAIYDAEYDWQNANLDESVHNEKWGE